ncbi:helix-turn-helix domain-containing protein [Alsobacter sp. SYSU M60028]|uniref:Helix-turn-helix domain-containing protein n=1 Tax=Alsobacter ponti TaxID=2962936 RepID=A0ABT1LEK0_9HYPH|nr:helix-turn-helix domain-containing protein [Alsobacter ponti]
MAISIPTLPTLRNAKAAERPRAEAPEVQFLTIRQVAQQLQVCTKTARRIISDKDIPILRVGRQIRIRSDHLSLFVSKQW